MNCFLKLSGRTADLTIATTAFAQVAPEGEVTRGNALSLDETVITVTAARRSKLRSSLAVSVLDPERIQESSPANAADILRDVPGVFAQASGGEGNANVTMRGLPISDLQQAGQGTCRPTPTMSAPCCTAVGTFAWRLPDAIIGLA